MTRTDTALLKRAASEPTAQLFLIMGVQDAQNHRLEHHVHISAQHIARRCDQIATPSVPGSHGTPSELKSPGDKINMSAVRIYFLFAYILASSWHLVVRTASGVGRVVGSGCLCELVLMPAIDLCPRDMMPKALSDRLSDEM